MTAMDGKQIIKRLEAQGFVLLRIEKQSGVKLK